MKKIDKNSRIGIWGFGAMGKSAVEYFYRQGFQISVMDKRFPTVDEQNILQQKNVAWYSQQQQELFFNSSSSG